MTTPDLYPGSAYRRDYDRGWRSGRRGSGLGYQDAAAGRPKWHIATCTPAHGIHDGTGGCTLD